jgi:uncharacterized protein YukE
VAAITEPISGNWNSLKASGEALTKAGDALDESLANLTKSLPQLDATWNGGAAQDFTSYVHRSVEAANQEPALNRIIGGVYDLVADQIEKVAKFIVERLKQVVDGILSRLATGWIPVVGQLRALDFIREAVQVFIKAKEMVDKAIELKDRAIELIEIAKDPIGHLRRWARPSWRRSSSRSPTRSTSTSAAPRWPATWPNCPRWTTGTMRRTAATTPETRGGQVRDEIPDYLRSAYGRLTETAAELDTLVVRAYETPLPEFEPMDPQQLAEAAKDPKAPAVRAVARAVAEGRTTWAEVASGGGRDVPEIRDLLQAGADRVVRSLAGEDVDVPPAPPRPRRPAPPDDDEDFSDWNFVRKDRY